MSFPVFPIYSEVGQVLLFKGDPVLLNLFRSLVASAFVIAVVGCGSLNWFVLKSSETLPVSPGDVGVNHSEIWIPSHGSFLNGWYAAGWKKAPLIVLFHGNSANISDCVEYVSILNRSGFTVCTFDYRGYGVSTGEAWNEEDLFDDGRSVLAFLRSKGWCSDTIIYYGQSMGAAVALQMALEHPPAGVILESPFTTFDDIASFHSPYAYGLLGKYLIDLPLRNITKISKIRTPLLILHGNEDQVVPVEMSLKLFAAARTRKKLHIVPGGGHCNGFPGERYSAGKIIAEFVESVPVRGLQRWETMTGATPVMVTAPGHRVFRP